MAKASKVILYYADWCGHCQNFKPEWNKFKQLANENGIKAVDFEANRDAKKIAEENIDGYPTIMLEYGANKTQEYTGQRNAKIILEIALGNVKHVQAAGGDSLPQCGGGKIEKSSNYRNKYEKYKAKYLILKQKLGLQQ